MNIFKLFDFVSRDCPATFFVVQHGPKWMTDLLAQQIRLEEGFPCHIFLQGLSTIRGYIYIAPGDQHIMVNRPPVLLGLYDELKENFIRSLGVVIFDSVGNVFEKFCVAVVLLGVCRDGA
jgi:two-component system, chemotaxis family, protein-glutamate methylesterase/glutaminase